MQPSPTIADLALRMDRFEQRLERIEAALTTAGQWVPAVEPAMSITPSHPARLEMQAPIEMTLPEIVTAELDDAPPSFCPPPLPQPLAHPSCMPRNPRSRLQDVVAARRPVPQRHQESQGLEATIGQNWASWVGAIVVVLGVCFFLKYAWDQGWLRVSPMQRVMAAVASGVGLMAAGQWVYRKAMDALAATLCGAGVAVMMAGFFASHTLFSPPVLSTGAVYGGVAAAAVIGILLSLRHNALTIAIISLLGQYLAPLLLRSHEDRSLSLMVYLGVLAIVGWSLSYLRPRWVVLRWFVWVCTAGWMALWLTNVGLEQHRTLAVVATAFFYFGFTGEAVVSLRRTFGGAAPGDPAPRDREQLDESLAAMSLLSTAAAFAALYAVLNPLATTPTTWLAMHPAAAAAILLACVQTALIFATPARQFTRGAMIQAAALVTIALPLIFREQAITISWLILGASLSALAWRTNNLPVRVWSVLLVGLALARVCAIDAFTPALTSIGFDFAGQPVTRWMLLAWGTAVLCHLVGWTMVARAPVPQSPTVARIFGPLPFEPSIVGTLLTAAGTLLFGGASLFHWQGGALTMLLILWTAILRALASIDRDALNYRAHAAIMVVLVTVLWFTTDGLKPMLLSWNNPLGLNLPFLNMAALNAALLAALTLSIGSGEPKLRPLSFVLAGGIVFAVLNFETLKMMNAMSGSLADPGTAKQVALSVLWATTGLAAIIVGFARRIAQLRYAALGLLGVTLLKIFLVDMAKVQTVYRIGSFLAVGVLLLVVSYVYHRQAGARQNIRDELGAGDR